MKLAKPFALALAATLTAAPALAGGGGSNGFQTDDSKPGEGRPTFQNAAGSTNRPAQNQIAGAGKPGRTAALA